MNEDEDSRRSDEEARRRLDARRANAGAPSEGGLVSGATAVMRYATQVGRRFAIVNAVERRARALEDRVVGSLSERLQSRERGGRGSSRARDGEAKAQRAFYVSVHEPPAQLLDELLGMAERQSADDARESLFSSLLRQLTPDEALLLARFSDGTPRAIAHLDAGGRLGVPGERLSGYFSLLEREISLNLPAMAPHYLQRLVMFGLLEEREPVPLSKAAHGSLQNHASVQAALAQWRKAKQRPRLRFASLRLSELGEALWRACRPGEGGPGGRRPLLTVGAAQG
jgi:hypothetical protein